MFRRMKETISICLDSKHYNNFVLINRDNFYFNHFGDYIKFYEVALSIVDKTNITHELKEYFVRMLSGISSLKPLHLKGFDKNTPEYNKEEYVQKIEKILDKFYGSVKIKNEFINIFDLREVSEKEFKGYTKEENFKLEPNDFICVSGELDGVISKEIAYPNSIRKKYSNYICGMVKIHIGDFYTDLFLELIDLYSTTLLSKNCMVYKAPGITEDQVHVEVALAVNNLIQALVYLKNSSSLRSNEFFCFDKWEVDRRMDISKSYLERAIILIDGIKRINYV